MYSPTSYSRRRWPAKDRERNLLAALLGIVVTVLLCTALAHPRWFYVKGGTCPRKYLGVYEFFYIGYFEPRLDDKREQSLSSELLHNDGASEGYVYHGYNETLVNCVTPHIVTLFRVVIAFVFLGIVASLFAFSLDTFGVVHRVLRTLKRNAVGSILTVVFCVNVVGLCYYLSTLLTHQLELFKVNRGTRVEVRFEVSFFLVTVAGAVAVLASAANLLKKYSPTEDTDDDALLDDFEGVETFSVNCLGGQGSDVVPRNQYPTPPPPYSP